MTSPDNLGNIMEFEHVIEVRGGTVIDAPSDIYAPETYVYLDDDGQVVTGSEANDLEHSLATQGWELFTLGYSGQYSYRGGVMHSSEYIGGQLAEDILSQDGYYVATVVTGLGPDPDENESEAVGWAVLRHELREIDTRNSR